MRNDLTELVLVMDRSGSMQSCVEDMEGAINALIKEQKEGQGDVSVSLVRFDNEVEVVFQGVDINEVEDIKLCPRGMTALNDGIGAAISTTGYRLAAMSEEDRPGLVIVAIITDGMENGSSEYTSDQIKSMVEHQNSKYNWQFVYLGANQDAFDTGRRFGFNPNHTSNYSTDSSDLMASGTSCIVSDMRSQCFELGQIAIYEDLGFTDEQRAEMNQEKSKEKA